MVGPPLRQNIQTNQLLFPHAPTDAAPNLLLLTTGDGSIKIAAWPPTASSGSSSSPALQTLHSLHAHTSACLSLALSPTGRYLAVGGSDALISLWDTQEWVCRKTLSGMQGGVLMVGFSWDGSFVAGACDEGNGIEIVSLCSLLWLGSFGLQRVLFLSRRVQAKAPPSKFEILLERKKPLTKTLSRHMSKQASISIPFPPTRQRRASPGIRTATG